MAGDSTTFSVAVVGLGMVGAAACRHLSATVPDPASVLGLGAAEPPESGGHLFASHYDQGRLTRIVDPDPVWSLLAARSIARYPEIEKQSGIQFHGRVGSLRVSPFHNAAGDTLARSLEVGRSNGAEVKLVRDPVSELPYFGFLYGETAVLESGGAGFVNPREMVRAQIAVAESKGLCIVRDAVCKIEARPSNSVAISTASGRIFFAHRVLICAGAHTNSLLPSSKLALKIKAVTALLAEVEPEETQRLQPMPSFIWRLKSDPVLHSVYGCPPIRYPDGKTYIKIGGTLWNIPSCISTEDELLGWFRSRGCQAEADALHRVLLQLLPGVGVRSLDTKPCVVTYSAHGYPYIDFVDHGGGQVLVAAAGCGAAAKSSDELGRIASMLACNGSWSDPQLDPLLFRAVFES